MKKGINRVLTIIISLSMLFSTASFAWAEDGVTYSDTEQGEVVEEIQDEADAEQATDMQEPVEEEQPAVEEEAVEPAEDPADPEEGEATEISEEPATEEAADEAVVPEETEVSDEESVVPEVIEETLPEDQTLTGMPAANVATTGNNLLAESSDVSEGVTYTLENGVLTISGNGPMEDYYYPSHSPWYSEKLNITTVIIENGVTSIGGYAFDNCRNLTSVTIPESVTSIEKGGFSYCSSLTSVTIPDGVTSIGDSAFYNCKNLTSITIPDSVKSIGREAFYYCSSLTSIVIPDGVPLINMYTFLGCSSLKSIHIPDSVLGIGYYAFSGCRSITDITIDENSSNYYIVDGILYSNNFNNLVLCPRDKEGEVIIKDGITQIDGFAFDGCKNLTGITLPEGMENIVYCAFSGCTSLTSITIPDSVTSISDGVFSNCTGLTNITIPENVTNIGDSAFNGCSGLTNIVIPESVTYIGSYAFRGCNNLTNIKIPDNVTGIGKNAFSNCSGLTDITIPKSVKNIYEAPFSGCSNLKNITLPEGITSIWGSLYSGCTGLETITIPDGVTSIGAKAFYECTNLTSVNLPETLKTIGDNVFYGCTSLSNIEIPKSVTTIQYGAFYGCSSLTNITIPENITIVNESMFRGCTSLESFTIPDAVTRIGYSAFEGCTSIKSIAIPCSVNTIADYAFSGCSALNSIVYYGDSLNWSSVSIGNYNDPLKVAVRYDVMFEYPDYSGTSYIPLITIKQGDIALVENTDYEIHSIKEAAEVGSTGEIEIVFKGAYEELLNLNYNYTVPRHVLNKTDHVSPTCVEAGNTEYWTCSNCGKLFSDEEGTIEITEADTYIQPTGHSWNDGEIKTQPTCTEEGVKEYACITCGETKEESIPATGHSWVLQGSEEPTCTTDGVNVYYCEVCHENKSEDITATGHTWDEGIVIEEPNYVDDGVIQHTCIVCGEVEDKPIPALGYPDGETIAWSDINTHSEIAFDKLRKKIADNYGGAYTHYFANTTNEKIYVSVSVIDNDLFFRYVFDTTVALREVQSIEFTLTSNGELGSIRYKADFTEISEGAAWGYLRKPANTFKSSGSYNYTFDISRGSGYKLSLTDTNEAANKALQSALMHLDLNLISDFDTRLCDIYFHNYGDWNDIHRVTTESVDPTCTEAGNTGITYCTICGSVKNHSASIPPTGHIWDSGVITKVATNDEPGIRKFTCTVCGETKEEEIPATGGHTWDEGVITVKPSCVKEGLKVYTCTDCGETIEVTLPANGHNWNHGIVMQSPTSTNDGVKKYTCIICGEEKQESIPAIGYPDECTNVSWDDISTHNALAFDKLRKEIIYNYGGSYTKYFTDNSNESIYIKVYPANDRLYFQYAFIQKTGLREQVKIEFALAQNGDMYQIQFSDNFTEVPYGEATGYLYASAIFFTTNSSQYNYDFNITRKSGYKSSVADANSLANTSLQSALMHLDINLAADFDTRLCDIYFRNYGTWNSMHHPVTIGAIDPTCTEAGNTGITYCTICGSIETDSESIPPTGHNWDTGVITQKATCEKSGSKKITCTECGEIREEVVPATGHNFKTTTAKATLTKNGSIVTKCATCGEVKSTKTIYYPKTIKLSVTSYTYDGKVKTPTVTVKDSKGNTISSANYTVTKASGRKNVGSYKYTIKFKGNYSGTKTLTFKINPKGTSLKTLTATSKGFKATWTKQATKMSTSYITGYQIQYSTSSTFASGNTTVTVSKYSTVSKTISKLKAKKKYYVRIRTYKTVSGVKYYSPWSAKKYVTTKA